MTKSQDVKKSRGKIPFVAVREVLEVREVKRNGTMKVVFKSWDDGVYVRTFRAEKITADYHQWSYLMGIKKGRYVRGYVTGATSGSDILLKHYFNS